MNSDRVFLTKIGGALLLLFFCLTATALQEAAAQEVYVTRTGEKYHRSACRYLKYSRIEIALRDAKKNGYTPCSVCKPDTTEGAQKAGAHSPAKPNSTTPLYKDSKPVQTPTSQCTAKTKAGSRCKRMTTSINGRCWQHQ